jgi:hypothetical protein
VLNVSVRIRKWPTKKLLEDKVVVQLKRYVGEIFTGVVSRSPVLTGSFRASWHVSFGVPEFVEINHADSLAPRPPPTFAWPDGYVIGQPIYITNGQPYAQRLEYGWSSQAPHGIIRVTLASVRFK